MAFLVPIIGRTRDQANLARCRDNLRKIGTGMIQYARLNGRSLPVGNAVDDSRAQFLPSLAAAQCNGAPGIYYCPSEPSPSLGFNEHNFKSGVIGYYYYSALHSSNNPKISRFLRSGVPWPRKLNTTMDPRTWVMSDVWISGVPTSHSAYRKGVNYLTLDGGVAFISDSPRQAFH
ncbi:MAG TPA: hypothetical protein VFC78_19140 [Tepidisphaeraceae bacterium]|nr:hypothetical protein [Tepidisphaeraceae bacterium]